MTEHKFTDEEVIKGFECCVGNEICTECPYVELINCVRQRDRNVLDLINRQKIEIESLKIANEKMYVANKEQESEIEKLTVELVGMRGAANSYKIHYDNIKDLNSQLEADIINANMNLEHITYELGLLKQEKSVVVAEAVKEFAEMLKKYYRHIDKTAGALIEYTIDKKVEQLLGGDVCGANAKNEAKTSIKALS